MPGDGPAKRPREGEARYAEGGSVGCGARFGACYFNRIILFVEVYSSACNR